MTSNNTNGGGASQEDGSIMGSIAALKTILMIDTPTKSILSRSASISLQQTRYDERTQYEDKIESLKAAASDMESKQERLMREFEKEKSVRKSLETTYEALLKHKKEMMIHMELLKNSRGKLEDELATNVTSLRNTKRSMEDAYEKWEKQVEAITGEKTAALASAADFETKYKESETKVKELDAKIAQLKTEIEESKQRYEDAVKEHSRLQEAAAEKLQETEAQLKTTETTLDEARGRVEAFSSENSEAVQEGTLSSSSSKGTCDLITEMQHAIAGPADKPGSPPDPPCVKSVAIELVKGLNVVRGALKKEEAEHLRKESELTSQLKLSNVEAEKIKGELASSQEQWQKMKAQLEEAKASLETKEKQIEELEKSLGQSENKRSISEVELADGGDAVEQEPAKRPKEAEEQEVPNEDELKPEAPPENQESAD